MKELLQRLVESLDRGQPLAYCRLVETRGSTPQKAGAMMLVFPDGSQAGTLGGGCVEAEVKRRALSVLAESASEVVSFQLDHDYGWDDGLICGGRMKILIESLDGRAETEPIAAYFRRLGDRVSAGEGVTEAISFDAQSSGLPAPASLLFGQQGELLASLHLDATDAQQETVRANLRPLDDRPRAYAQSGVAFLPLLSRCRLVIVGGGHVGQAVADLAYQLEFEVWVVDDREEIVSEERFPGAERRIHGGIDEVLPALEIDANTYCLIVTRGHNHDEQALFHLVSRNARYVGLIGSRRKIKMIFDDLLGEGVPREDLERVHAPLGIDIGSQTVPEIAVSICAELVAHRNCGGRVPGRPEPLQCW